LWYVAGLLVLFAYLAYRRRANWMIGTGVALVLLGVAPSALARFLSVPPDAMWTRVYPSLVGLPRLGWLEGACLLGGVLVLAAAFRRAFDFNTLPPDAAKVGWMLAVTLPYFAVFFWLYSYHYRLAFAVVPLMAAPTAVVLARWFPNADVRAWGGGRRWLFTGAVLLLALPGVVLPLRDKFLGWDYLWNGDLTDDTAKRTSGNEALMWMVDGFRAYEAEHGEPPVIAAPGVQRLPFFFPLADIRIDEAPTRLSELDGVTYFVDSHPDGTGAYERKGVPLLQNQVLSALGRQDILRRAWWRDDGIFRYEIYELHLANRFEPKEPLGAAEGDVVFGGFARFLGHEISSRTFQIGQRRTVKLYWEVLDEAHNDYMTYIHLRDSEDKLQMAWDGPVSLTEDGRYYTTLVWEPGEYIVDDRLLQLTNFDAPTGDGYSIVIGLYDLATGERVPVTQNGEPIGGGYRLDEPITVTPPEPDG
jgi:hypothetical protein